MTGAVAPAVDRSWACPVLHVDMDAFYASVALREHPELAAVPTMVGGGPRGIVLSANYPARARGVRSAMPMTRALRLCPDGVVVPPDHGAFAEVSRAVVDIFTSITPDVEVLSLDEAYLEVSGATRRLGSPLRIAQLVRATVHAEQRITCSVGLAPTPTVAKMATNAAKPDGVRVVPPEDVVPFLHGLRLEEVHGIGERTAAALRRLELRTVEDLARMPLPVLRRALGDGAARHLLALAQGHDPRRVQVGRSIHRPERTLGNEETFARDTADATVLRRELLRLGTKVAGRMRAAGLVGRTVSIRVRYADFRTLTRSRALAEPTDVTQVVVATAHDLLASLEPLPMRVRLVGVRAEGLVPKGRTQRQLALGEREHGWPEVDAAVDRAAGRFGGAAVRPASLMTDRP